MSAPGKKGGHEEGGGHAPMWIVSFADMVILLMSFFVLLLVKGEQKTASNEDMLRVLASVKLGFGYVPKADSKDPLDLAVFQVMAQKNSGKFPNHGQRWLPAAIEGEKKKEADPWVKAQSNVGKPIRFGRNADELPKTAGAELDEIAEIVRHHYRMIVIQGHCTADEASHDVLKGHDICFRRAVAVKLALEARGVSSSRLRMVTCANHESHKDVKTRDRQLVIVTLGQYFLPQDHDVIEDEVEKASKNDKAGSHKGH